MEITYWTLALSTFFGLPFVCAYCAIKAVGDLRARKFVIGAFGALSSIAIMAFFVMTVAAFNGV